MEAGIDRTAHDWGPPRGREEVRDALMTATERLCEERSPGKVSVREIAGEAGVNHGQVQHYFGSKLALIAATMERIEADLIDRIAGGTTVELPGLIKIVSNRPAFTRMIAWIILEGSDRSVFEDLWFGKALSERLREAGRPEAEARALAAQIMVLAGGWALFRPAISVATGLDAGEAGQTQESLQRLAESLVESPIGGSP
jgi:AcrR family transcriptional regulator